MEVLLILVFWCYIPLHHVCQAYDIRLKNELLHSQGLARGDETPFQIFSHNTPYFASRTPLPSTANEIKILNFSTKESKGGNKYLSSDSGNTEAAFDGEEDETSLEAGIPESSVVRQRDLNITDSSNTPESNEYADIKDTKIFTYYEAAREDYGLNKEAGLVYLQAYYHEELRKIPGNIRSNFNWKDPLSLVGCPPDFSPISLQLCARKTNETYPLIPVCQGNAKYDVATKTCYVEHQAQPFVQCPPGFVLSKFYADFYSASCKAELDVAAAPKCDPPYELSTDGTVCFFREFRHGLIGCPGGTKRKNRSYCEAALQKQKFIKCPETYQPFLKGDSTGVCRKTFITNFDLNEVQSCPESTSEAIVSKESDLTTDRLICREVQEIPGKPACEPDSIPYEDYLQLYDHPVVMTNPSFQSPLQTCVYMQSIHVQPYCQAFEEIPYLLYGEINSLTSIPTEKLVPASSLQGIITDWSRYKAIETEDGGSVVYRHRNISFSVVCATKHYAKPTLRCPEGYVHKKVNPTTCRNRSNDNFVLSCPEGYVLNAPALLYQHYSKPSPICISRIPSLTTYQCEKLESYEAEHHSLLFEDQRSMTCYELRTVASTFSPTEDTMEKLFPSWKEVNSDGKLMKQAVDLLISSTATK